MFALSTSSRCAGVSEKYQRTSDSSWSSALGAGAGSFTTAGSGGSCGTWRSLPSTNLRAVARSCFKRVGTRRDWHVRTG